MRKRSLRQMRVAAGYTTLEEAARALGVTRQHISVLELGKSGTTLAQAAKIAKLYRVSVLEILETVGRTREVARLEAIIEEMEEG